MTRLIKEEDLNTVIKKVVDRNNSEANVKDGVALAGIIGDIGMNKDGLMMVLNYLIKKVKTLNRRIIQVVKFSNE